MALMSGTIDLETLPYRMLIISNYLPITVYCVEDDHQNNKVHVQNFQGHHVFRKKGPCGMSTASQGFLINPKPPNYT